MITKFKLFESIKSTDKEYFDAVEIHYNEELVSMIKQGEEIAFNMSGVRNAITEKTDGGNLIIRYCIGNNMLLILGAVAKSGKMNREDMKDMNTWLNFAVDKLDEGMTIMTSPNELSEPLIKKLIKISENRELKLNIQTQNIDMFQYDNLTWKHYIIKKI